MYFRAIREARRAREMLILVQAVDRPKAGALTPQEYRNALHTQSLPRTGNFMGFYAFYRGMRQRLTTKLCARHQLVQDAPCVCLDMLFHPDEFLAPGSDWRCNPQHPAWECGYVILKHLPTAVLARFDGLEDDLGYGPGVLAIEPVSAPWSKGGFQTRDPLPAGGSRPRKVPLARTQVPLAPDKNRTIYSAQGLSMDAAMMFLKKRFPP